MDELIKDLRIYANDETDEIRFKAADAIEQLVKDLERSKEWETFWEKEANEALKKFQTTVASKPRWIPATERLPEDLQNVLVIDDGRVTIGHCEHFYGDEQIFVEWHDTLYYPIDPPYWMPLPPAPKEE